MKYPIPYQFGISIQHLKPFDVNEQKARRLEKLLKLKEADLIVKICKHYLCNFIPAPVEHEDIYWIMSCFPSTDHSPVRISIWFPEVFNIHQANHYYNHTQNLHCLVFTHADYFDSQTKRVLERKIKGLRFHPEYRFITGIDKQLAAFLPITSYFPFVEDERIFESIRSHNYELTLKGRTPFKKGHNYSFVRYLLRS